MHPLRLSWDAPVGFPVSLATVKSHLRIEHEEFDPLILEVFLPAAVEWAEGVMHRAIVERTHYWVLSDFPRGIDQSIRLTRGKAQSVASIAYTSNNATTTLTGPTSSTPGTDYREELASDSGGVLFPPYGETWPSVDFEAPAPVLITFVAGWVVADVPADIKHAISMYVSDGLNVNGASDPVVSDLDVKQGPLTSWRIARC